MAVKRGCGNFRILEKAIAIILSRISDCGQITGNAILSDPLLLEKKGPVHPLLHQLTPEDFYHANERVTAVSVVVRSLTGDSGVPVDASLKAAVDELKKT